VFVQRTEIGAPTDHKENIYKKIVRRRKKVGGCRTIEFGKRQRESYKNSIIPFFSNKKNNWMEIDKERSMCSTWTYYDGISLLSFASFRFLYTLDGCGLITGHNYLYWNFGNLGD
jgi:hypothetical protein